MKLHFMACIGLIFLRAERQIIIMIIILCENLFLLQFYPVIFYSPSFHKQIWSLGLQLQRLIIPKSALVQPLLFNIIWLKNPRKSIVLCQRKSYAALSFNFNDKKNLLINKLLQRNMRTIIFEYIWSASLASLIFPY